MIEYMVSTIGVIGTMLFGVSLLCVVSVGAALLVASAMFEPKEEDEE